MAPLPNASYVNGANLGGWLVMENWLFPNVLLLRLGDAGITNNQELDYIWRMRERGIDEVASMHAHWNTFLGGKLLDATEPPPRAPSAAAAGVEAVRIPVGWWALEEPAEEYDGPEAVASGSSAPAVRAKYERPGVTSDGFVTGGALYLARLLLRGCCHGRQSEDRVVPDRVTHTYESEGSIHTQGAVPLLVHTHTHT